jgi:hypothetical protein
MTRVRRWDDEVQDFIYDDNAKPVISQDKKKFIEFIQGLAGCDHMGDVADDVNDVLEYLGVPDEHPMLEKYDGEQYLVGVAYALHDIYGTGYGEDE